MHITYGHIRQANITRIGHAIGVGNNLANDEVSCLVSNLRKVSLRCRPFRRDGLVSRRRGKRAANWRTIGCRCICNCRTRINVSLRDSICGREIYTSANGQAWHVSRGNCAERTCARMHIRNHNIIDGHITRVGHGVCVGDNVAFRQISCDVSRFDHSEFRRKSFRRNALIRCRRHISPAWRTSCCCRRICDRAACINIVLCNSIGGCEIYAAANWKGSNSGRRNSGQCPRTRVNVRDADVSQSHITCVLSGIRVGDDVTDRDVRRLIRDLRQSDFRCGGFRCYRFRIRNWDKAADCRIGINCRRVRDGRTRINIVLRDNICCCEVLVLARCERDTGRRDS